MPNIHLFHCPKCDTIEPFKFHRKPYTLDSHHMETTTDGVRTVVCNSCKHREPFSFNATELPGWLREQPEGYDKLTEEQRELFEQVHKKHLSAFGTEDQRKYARHNILKLQWDKEEKTVNVYYDDVWWHYDIEKGYVRVGRENEREVWY